MSRIAAFEACYVGSVFLALFVAGLLPAPAAVVGYITAFAVASGLVLIVGGES